MADKEQLDVLKRGVPAWNAWREAHPTVRQDLRGAPLSKANLRGANLIGANLSRANLIGADLRGADLRGANLSRAALSGANLIGANLRGALLLEADLIKADLNRASLVVANLDGANLIGANLRGASLRWAHLVGVNLRDADLGGADLIGAELNQAFLSGANLIGANLRGALLLEADLRAANLCGARLGDAFLSEANLRGALLLEADLREAVLSGANLIGADLTDADLTGCHIHGVSAWRLRLSQGTKQQDLVITQRGEPEVTVDNIEVAQFVYLLLHNEKIRDVIDTIGKKAVLILGRFTEEHKAVLDRLREELRKHDYLPILFDFRPPTSKDLTGTVLTLAHMARFIIADLTDPSCIPYEVSKVADAYVPIQPILLSGKSEFAMFADMQRRHHWVLPTHNYDNPERLIADLGQRVIGPAEAKVEELQKRRPG